MRAARKGECGVRVGAPVSPTPGLAAARPPAVHIFIIPCSFCSCGSAADVTSSITFLSPCQQINCNLRESSLFLYRAYARVQKCAVWAALAVRREREFALCVMRASECVQSAVTPQAQRRRLSKDREKACARELAFCHLFAVCRETERKSAQVHSFVITFCCVQTPIKLSIHCERAWLWCLLYVWWVDRTQRIDSARVTPLFQQGNYVELIKLLRIKLNDNIPDGR